MSERTRTDRLGVAVARLARGARVALGVPAPRPDAQQGVPRDPSARLDAIEREVSEVRTRVNALFFAVISVAIGDLVVRAVQP